MQNIFIELLPPWIETGLQPAFYDKESGTVLQQVSRMWAKMIELGQGFNTFSTNVTDTVNSYITQFNELHAYVHDYFDNLDVQEEINNKLDDMAEAGTLADIISQYLNSTALFGYDNVASMKSATNLVAGSYAKTLGYHAKNDGGGATYKIRSITNNDVVDEATIIEMGDGADELIAELVIEPCVNVNQFGAYGDGVHDDAQAIQKALSSNKIKSLEFIASCTYLVNSAVTLTNKILIKGNKAVIKLGSSVAKLVIGGSGIDSYQSIDNVFIDGDFKASIGLEVAGCRSLRANNVYIRNVCEKGIYVHPDPVTGFGTIMLDNFNIENIIENATQLSACTNAIGIDLSNTDSQIMNGNIKEFRTAIKCLSETLVYGVHAWNYQDSFVADSIMIDAYGGVRIIGCYCDGLPIFVKQNTDSQYSNIEMSECKYNFGISQQVTAHPYVIYKGTNDHVNISNSSFDCSYSDGTTTTWAVANTFENLYHVNTFCVRCYFTNFYKGVIEQTGVGKITYERIGETVYYYFEAGSDALSASSLTTKLPIWARPSRNTWFTLTNSGKLCIVNDGTVGYITCPAYASGDASSPARYLNQQPNPNA